MKTAQNATYTTHGRVAHGYPLEAAPGPRVMDDFGNSTRANSAQLHFFLRGPVAAFQPEQFYVGD